MVAVWRRSGTAAAVAEVVAASVSACPPPPPRPPRRHPTRSSEGTASFARRQSGGGARASRQGSGPSAWQEPLLHRVWSGDSRQRTRRAAAAAAEMAVRLSVRVLTTGRAVFALRGLNAGQRRTVHPATATGGLDCAGEGRRQCRLAGRLCPIRGHADSSPCPEHVEHPVTGIPLLTDRGSDAAPTSHCTDARRRFHPTSIDTEPPPAQRVMLLSTPHTLRW